MSSSTGITLRITVDAEAVEAAMTRAVENFPRYVNSWLVQSATITKEEMKARVNEGVGAAIGQGIKNNIDATYSPGSVFVGPNKNVPYALYLDQGTRPHRPPTDPDGALAQWCELKGLNVYAIAATIAKKGTQPHPFVQPTYDAVSDPIRALFTDGVARFVDALGVEV